MRRKLPFSLIILCWPAILLTGYTTAQAATWHTCYWPHNDQQTQWSPTREYDNYEHVDEDDGSGSWDVIYAPFIPPWITDVYGASGSGEGNMQASVYVQIVGMGVANYEVYYKNSSGDYVKVLDVALSAGGPVQRKYLLGPLTYVGSCRGFKHRVQRVQLPGGSVQVDELLLGYIW
jgi:hypothetical protein